ncbi:MAG: ABC transporter ATP-binding protein, partial [Bacteroidia bacterium]
MSKAGNIFDRELVRRLFSYTQPYRAWFILGIILTIVIATVSVIRPSIYQFILDKKVAVGDVEGVRFWILITFCVLCLESTLGYVNTLLTNWLGQSVIRDIRSKVFEHILHLRLSYYDKTPIGTLQTRTVSDVETLNDVFRSGLVKIMGDILQVVSIFIIMLYKKWDLALVVLTTLPLLLYATRVFQKKVKNSFQGVRKAVSDMNAFLQEHITGMNIVQIFNRENIEAKKFDGINQELRKENINSVLYYSIFFPVIEIITAIALSLLVWYGVRKIIVDTEMTTGALVAFISYVNMFFRPIRMLADEFNTLQMGMVSADRIFKVLDTQEFIPNNADTPLVISSDKLEIELKNVWFSYNT